MTRTDDNLARFIAGYCEAMIWANTTVTVDGEPDDEQTGDLYPSAFQTPRDGWQLEAFDLDAQESIESDCRDFLGANMRDVVEYVRRLGDSYGPWEAAGHDFALTRNGHGAGFRDRGLGEVGERLTANAKPYGESSGYLDENESEIHLD